MIGAVHRRRLRQMWRSAGWPCQDMVELELLAAGLLERQRDEAGRETLRVTDAGVQLLQNRPNPFSERTTIGFILPKACEAQLRVFDVNGRELLRIDRAYPAGYSEEAIRLDGTAAGLLYYELTTPDGTLTKKMMILGE